MPFGCESSHSGSQIRLLWGAILPAADCPMTCHGQTWSQTCTVGHVKTTPEAVRAIIYTRVSTGQQAESGLGLTDQLDRATAAVAERGWTLVHVATDAGHSGKRLSGRPALTEALAMLDRGEADALVTLKLDRLSRSVQDFASLLGQAQRKGWQVVALDVGVDTSTPAGKMVANVMAAISQWESEVIGERTAAAHRVRREAGMRIGQVPILSTAVHERIAHEVGEGRSLRAIALDLNTEGVATAKGGIWYASTVAHVSRSVARDAELAATRDAVA